jgi:TolB-like protein
MAAVELRLLGEFEARDWTGLPLPVRAKKNRALLAALALAPACSMPRARIANLLWSDRNEAQAQSSLRQALVALRKDFATIDPSPLSADRDRLALDAKRVEIDATAFERLAASEDVAALRRAASLYRGSLLSDIYVRDPAFDEWLGLERARLASCARRVLGKLCELETGAERTRFAEQLVALDPLREASHRTLMQVHCEAGDKALAVRQYELCQALLRDELRVAPDAQTEALYRRILNGRSPDEGEPAVSAISTAASRAPPAAPAVGDKPSVAVLPLGAINGDPELDGFCEGLTDDIVTGLSRVAAIRVIARNTTLTYKRRAVDVRTVGRELGVQYVIEGSARWSETKIRVSAQLTEAVTGHHIWTQQVDRTRSEMLDVQDDIAKSIVASVQTQLILNEGRKSTASGDPTGNASQLLARAWQRFLRLTEESLAECGALAGRVLELDSKSGMGNCLLAVTLYHHYMGFIPWSQTVIDRLYLHATAAIGSDDADEYCHWAMCCAHLLRNEHALAIASLRRGLKINPNCSLLHGSMGTVLAWDGQHEHSIECNELVLRINPQDPSNVYRHFGLALACYLARRYDEALLHAMDVVETRPSWWLGQLIFCATLAQLGRHDEAVRALDNVTGMRSRMDASTLGILPFARPSDREHLLDGLRKAGLSA